MLLNNVISKLKFLIFVIISIKCFSLPNIVDSYPYNPRCNCILLKNCKPYVNLLLNSDTNYRTIVVDLIKKNTCDFSLLDVMVCCPTSFQPEGTFRFPGMPPPTYRTNKQLVKLVDYRDDRTDLNCPHIFYEERNTMSFSNQNRSHFSFQVNHSERPKDAILFPDDERFKYRSQHSYEASQQIFNDSREKAKTSMKIAPTKDRKIIFPNEDSFVKTKSILIDNFSNEDFESNDGLLDRSRETYTNPPDCGVSLNSRLLGGNESLPGQFPWIVRIGYRNKSTMSVSYRCSGSFLSDTFILTAAHCVTNLVPDLELTHVTLGDSFEGTRVITFPISNVVIHPNYDKPKYANDIALVKIDNPLSNEGYFSKICLPLNNSSIQADKLIGLPGIVAGWVNQNDNDPIDSKNATVKFLRLSVVNNTECAITYASFTENFVTPIIITPAHMCAQSSDNKNDVCQGDSGGPFMDDGSSGIFNSQGRYTLLGIVAFGPTVCGFTHIPGVYMRVTSFLDWIISIIK